MAEGKLQQLFRGGEEAAENAVRLRGFAGDGRAAEEGGDSKVRETEIEMMVMEMMEEI